MTHPGQHDEWLARVSRLLDGELHGEELRQLEDHLARCEQCAVVARDLGTVVNHLKLATREQSRSMIAPLWPAIASELTPRAIPPVPSADRLEHRARQMIAAALLLLTGALFGWWVGSAKCSVGGWRQAFGIAASSPPPAGEKAGWSVASSSTTSA